MLITSDSLWAGIEASRTLMNGFSHMLRHSLLNENARALPVGALATYALRTFNGTNEKYRSPLKKVPLSSPPPVLLVSIGSLFFKIPQRTFMLGT